MKKQNITVILTACLLMIGFLVLDCSNVLSPVNLNSGGKGNVTVSFAAGKAALSPAEMDYDFYEFIFTRTADDTSITFVEGKKDVFTFSLDKGASYNLEVKTYKGERIPANHAASGSYAGSFTVGDNIQILVRLNGFIKGGPAGTFSFNIIYPEGAVIEDLLLLVGDNDADNKNLETSAVNTGSGVSGSVNAAAGHYLLVVRLKINDKWAGYANGVDILSGQTTYYGTADEPIVFTSEDFKDLIGKPVTKWNGFDVAGWSHYYDNDRASPGFNLNSTYDPARAIGTQYDVFSDGDGNIFFDVLKLEPPEYNDPNHFRYLMLGSDPFNGYEQDTVALTYKTEKEGLYRLSMNVWVEESAEDVSVWWSNTGANYLDDGGTHEKSWRVLAGSDKGNVNRRQWLPIQGTFTLRANEEIGIIPRFLHDESGLRDAVIYIRDINLEYRGIPVIITPLEDLTMGVGGFQVLKVSGSVLWSTSNPDVATVDQYGKVTAVGPGTVTISAQPLDGSAEINEKVIKVIAKGSGKYIALTFDDGPEPDWSPQFVEVLNRYGARATFYVMGKKVYDHPDIAKIYTEGGQEIGNHTYWHWQEPEYRPTTQKTIEAIKAELIMASNLIEDVTGYRPTNFRAPTLRYLHNYTVNDYSPEYDEIQHQFADKLEEACRQLGYPIIDTYRHHEGDYDWDSSRNEFRPGQLRNPEELTHRAMSLAKNWGILLTHDGNTTNVANNIKGLPLLLEALYADGYEVMSVSQIAAKSKELRGTPDLEPGRIYYDFENIPAHVTGITVNSAGTKVSYMDDDPVESRPVGISILNIGGALNLSAAISGGQQQLFWYSDNPSIASVDKYTGVVTAVNNGFTAIRVGAGGRRALVSVSVGHELITDTVTEWAEIQDGWAGWFGHAFNESNPAEDDNFYPSGAQVTKLNSWQAPGDMNIFTNVLKLAPPAPGQDYYSGPNGGSIAVNFRIPQEGEYSFSVDIWVDTSTCIPDYLDKFKLVWWNASEKTYWNALAGLPFKEIPAGWYTLESSVPLQMDTGSTIGLYMRNGGDAEGLRGATVYLKNMRLTRAGATKAVIDIKSEGSQVTIPTINTWEGIQDGWAGWYRDLGHDKFYSSNAEVTLLDSWQVPGEFNIFSNVLKLAPPSGGNYYLGPDGGSLAVNYNVPCNGQYSLSVDIWIDTSTCMADYPEKFRLIWWSASEALGWAELATLESGVIPSGWYTLQSSSPLTIDAGSTIGLYMRNKGDVEGLRDATVYLKNLKLELAGVANAVINIPSVATIAPPLEWDTITSWDVIDKAGSAGSPAPGMGAPYKSSGALWSVSSGNVLKIYPPAGGYTTGGTIAAAYTVPFDGKYSLSLDVRVEQSNGRGVDIAWYDWSNFGVLTKVWGVESYQGDEFYSIDKGINDKPWSNDQHMTSTVDIKAGTVIGLLTSLYSGDAEGVRDAVIYIKNFKLELEHNGRNYVILDIAATPQVPADQSITLKWAEDGSLIEADATTVVKGGKVTIIAPPGLPLYEWHVGRDIISGPEETHRSFDFDSTNRAIGLYAIGFYSGTEFGGDAVKITVTE